MQSRRITLYVTVLLVSNIILLTTRHYGQYNAALRRREEERVLPKPSYRNVHFSESTATELTIGEKVEGTADSEEPATSVERSLSEEQTSENVHQRLQELETSVRHTNDDAVDFRAALLFNMPSTALGKETVRAYILALGNITSKYEILLKKILAASPSLKIIDELKTAFTGNETHNASFEDVLVPVLSSTPDVSKHVQENDTFRELDAAAPKQTLQNVAFLKVHKAGSTTVQNILQRYALTHQLNVVLPNKNKTTDPHYHYLGDRNGFSGNDIIPVRNGETYNMILNHAVYNRKSWSSVLERESTVYLAIIREPESRFLSAAFYYGLVKRLHKRNPSPNSTKFIFTEYLKNPKNYTTSHYFYNAMSYDFGIPESSYNNPTEILQHAKRLVEEFDLIMLVEYFDHSLILLKRRLNWQLRDILYLHNNKGARKASEGVFLSAEDKSTLRKWQSADVILYKVFSDFFWTKIQQERGDFFQEVEHFKNLQGYLLAFCSSPKQDDVLTVKQSKFNDAFSLTTFDCNKMMAKEFDLHDELVHVAWGRFQSEVPL
ncbi:galactose-3-O-sulfotransferase 3 [Aplysia californica]|uniref:Galactose-3-O-sulfotransferase 3 n=1 Tax=Aplysia californica TaxID=6500 RepID=A0ABM1AFN3_APLCA|nr:galactose-3-O-sulfotransferase 3 [Aplysia californica]